MKISSKSPALIILLALGSCSTKLVHSPGAFDLLEIELSVESCDDSVSGSDVTAIAAPTMVPCTSHTIAAARPATLAVIDEASKSIPGEASIDLDQFFEDEWNWSAERDPITASSFGERAFNGEWPDLSEDAAREANDHYLSVIRWIDDLPPDRVPLDDLTNAKILQIDYRNRSNRLENQLNLLALNHLGGLQTSDELVFILPFETLQDYRDYVRRLETFAPLTEGVISLLRRGVEAGVMLPRVVMERVPGQIDRKLDQSAIETLYYQPFRQMADSISPDARASLQRRAAKAIAEQVFPSLRKLRSFVVDRYLPAAPDRVGIWTFDGDGQIYQDLIREHTSTELTAEEIHQIGLDEVARIRAEMTEIMQRVGFEGSLIEFNEHLRRSPEFFHETEEELLEAYRATAKRVDPELVGLFGTMPRMPYGVTPIPDASAPDTYAAFYYPPTPDGSRAGTFFVNLYRPDQRPTYEIMALTLHEAVPGHHFQLALSQENPDVPRFRRYIGYTVFREGWALYAESLGDEMGLFDDPYDKFGQLTYEMWRAIRLVVDTGIHAKRWTRHEAIDYFMENAAKSELDVVNEIDRYIVDPGQALAYKIGELKIRELRTGAEQRLGERFDIRGFHDAVLLNGGVPLDVLEQQVERWVAYVEAVEE